MQGKVKIRLDEAPSNKQAVNKLNRRCLSFISLLSLFLILCYLVVSNMFLKDANILSSDKLLSWAAKNGIHIRNMQIHSFPFGRGVIATDEVGTCTWRSGFCAFGPENFLVIPRSVVFSVDKVEKGSVVEAILNQLSDYTALVVFLLSEIAKGEESFWFPYLDSLPKSYDDIAAWKNEEISYLQQDELFSEESNKQKEGRILAYHEVEKVFKRVTGQNGLPFSFEEFLWASSVIDTRVFGAKDDLVLLPIGDLINHYPDCPGNFRAENLWDGVIEPTINFYFEEYGKIPKGKEVCIRYRKTLRTNFLMLTKYGFIQVDNAFNEETINYLGEKYIITKIPSWDFLKSINSLDLPETKLSLIKNKEKSKIKRNENRKFANCIQILQTIFASLPTSLETDRYLLRKMQSTNNQEGRLFLALLYRVERKKLLKNELVFCQDMLLKELPCLTNFYLKNKTIKYYKLMESKNKWKPFMAS